jgi:hypothetical protein
MGVCVSARRRAKELAVFSLLLPVWGPLRPWPTPPPLVPSAPAATLTAKRTHTPSVLLYFASLRFTPLRVALG